MDVRQWATATWRRCFLIRSTHFLVSTLGSMSTPVLPSAVTSSLCPSRRLLDHIMSRWGVLVLLALEPRTLRWAELRRTIDGISEKMLAQTLQTLAADGLVRREARPVVPPHVEYSLTDDGREVAALIGPLVDWVAVRAGDAGARAAVGR